MDAGTGDTANIHAKAELLSNTFPHRVPIQNNSTKSLLKTISASQRRWGVGGESTLNLKKNNLSYSNVKSGTLVFYPNLSTNIKLWQREKSFFLRKLTFNIMIPRTCFNYLEK